MRDRIAQQWVGGLKLAILSVFWCHWVPICAQEMSIRHFEAAELKLKFVLPADWQCRRTYENNDQVVWKAFSADTRLQFLLWKESPTGGNPHDQIADLADDLGITLTGHRVTEEYNGWMAVTADGTARSQRQLQQVLLWVATNARGTYVALLSAPQNVEDADISLLRQILHDITPL